MQRAPLNLAPATIGNGGKKILWQRYGRPGSFIVPEAIAFGEK
jgi:hypothetical protein